MPVRPVGIAFADEVRGQARVGEALFEAVGQCRLPEMRVEVHGGGMLRGIAAVHRVHHRDRRGQPMAAMPVVLRLAVRELVLDAREAAVDLPRHDAAEQLRDGARHAALEVGFERAP